MAKSQFDVLKEEFQNECKVINLRYEYEGYIGEEQWAIISELSEEEILKRYKPFIQEYIPFLVLPPIYGEVRQQFRRNENKHYMRMVRGHFYSLEEDLEEHHTEIAVEDCAAQIFAQEQSRELWEAINFLNEKQRKRLIAYYFEGKTYREIADEGGVDHKAIIRSVEIALKNLTGERIIPMLADVKDALKTEYKQQIEDGFNESVIDGYSGFIFKSRYNTVLSPHGVNRVLDRIIKAYNTQEEQAAKRERRKPELLPHFSCHNLRHTFCTRFCENETNLKVIQEIMGHADITTTMDIYNEATKEKKMESFAGLEGKIKIR